MSGIDFYKHLEKVHPFTVELSMDDIARKCVKLNYGVHRLLSSLVRELRAANKRHEEKWNEQHPDDDPSENPHTGKDSPLAKGIEELLNQGLFY